MKGELLLFGENPWTDAVNLHKRLAYVPGDVNLWDNFTGDEMIELLAKMRGNINPKAKKDLVEAFGLDTTKKCRAYSKRKSSKSSLNFCLRIRCRFVYFGRTQLGLDPLMEEVFKEIVKKKAAEGKNYFIIQPYSLRSRGTL